MSKGREITIREALEKTEGLMEALGPEAKIAGSLRRKYMSEEDLDSTVKDVDVVVCRPVDLSEVEPFGTVMQSGERKIRLLIDMPHVEYDEDEDVKGLQVDIVVCEPEEFGACLLYLTGPYGYNVEMRSYAKGAGLKLNEKGLWRGDERVAGKREQDIYKALGLMYQSPSNRGDGLKPAANSTVVWTTVVLGSKGDRYKVSLREDGRWHCCLEADGKLCKGYQFSRKRPKTCKHIEKTAKPRHEAEEAAAAE